MNNPKLFGLRFPLTGVIGAFIDPTGSGSKKRDIITAHTSNHSRNRIDFLKIPITFFFFYFKYNKQLSLLKTIYL